MFKNNLNNNKLTIILKKLLTLLYCLQSGCLACLSGHLAFKSGCLAIFHVCVSGRLACLSGCLAFKSGRLACKSGCLAYKSGRLAQSSTAPPGSTGPKLSFLHYFRR